MQIEKIEFDSVRYNPERAGFEALVNVRDQGETYSYAVHVAAPLHADYTLLTRHLARTAATLHRARHSVMRTVRPTSMPSYQARVDRILAENAMFLAESALWEAREDRHLAA